MSPVTLCVFPPTVNVGRPARIASRRALTYSLPSSTSDSLMSVRSLSFFNPAAPVALLLRSASRSLRVSFSSPPALRLYAGILLLSTSAARGTADSYSGVLPTEFNFLRISYMSMISFLVAVCRLLVLRGA